jgi:hypothetical protein
MDLLPPHARQLAITKGKIKPFHKSVVRFRDLMIKNCSPIDKLFGIKELKELI